MFEQTEKKKHDAQTSLVVDGELLFSRSSFKLANPILEIPGTI